MKHAALALALMMGAFAGACGSAAPAPETAAGKTEPAEGETVSSAHGEGAADKGKKPEGATVPTEKALAAVAPAAKSTPLQRTALEADLQKIGINLDKVPELEKLPMAQKKKVMPLLQRSLGYESCQGCHAAGNDFAKQTRNMMVAREMWRHFVVPLRTEKGGTLFCDSCHAGKEQVLARGDKKAIHTFMESDYQGKLSQASKAEMECSTCHGDAMETKIIQNLWKIPK